MNINEVKYIFNHGPYYRGKEKACVYAPLFFAFPLLCCMVLLVLEFLSKPMFDHLMSGFIFPLMCSTFLLIGLIVFTIKNARKNKKLEGIIKQCIILCSTFKSMIHVQLICV